MYVHMHISVYMDKYLALLEQPSRLSQPYATSCTSTGGRKLLSARVTENLLYSSQLDELIDLELTEKCSLQIIFAQLPPGLPAIFPLRYYLRQSSA